MIKNFIEKFMDIIFCTRSDYSWSPNRQVIRTIARSSARNQVYDRSINGISDESSLGCNASGHVRSIRLIEYVYITFRFCNRSILSDLHASFITLLTLNSSISFF